MLYRRHLRTCTHRRAQRSYRRCGCPIWLDASVKGRRVNKSLRVADWNTAQELARKLLAGEVMIAPVKEPELAPPTCKTESLSVVTAWERFIAQAKARQLNAATIYKYDLLRRRMEDFAQRRGIQLLKDFDLAALEAFLAEGKEGALARLKKMERTKAFFRFALDRRWIEENPSRLLRGPKVRQRPTLPFTPEEMATILAAVKLYPSKSRKTGRANSIQLRAFILTLRYTGLRIGDATALTTDRLVGNKIFLYSQKTGVPVNCVVPEFVAEALETMPRLSEKYFFWTGNSTLHTAIGRWQRTLHKLFMRIGIRGYAHRFRDTFAVELLLAGVPTEEVAILLGHSNIKITQEHYSPWVRSRQLQLEANLARAWNRDPMVLLNTKTESSSTATERPN